MPSARLESAIPAVEGLQTNTFDSTASRIGDYEVIRVFRARYWRVFTTKMNKYLFMN
jgi:hypothetical protein